MAGVFRPRVPAGPNLLQVMGLALLVTSCAASHRQSDRIQDRIEPPFDLVYAADGHRLFLHRAGASPPEEIIQRKGHILSPVWSPDGRQLAFYETSGFFAVLDQQVKLMLLDTATHSAREFGSFKFPVDHDLERLDLFRKRREFMTLTIPPLWKPDGRSLLVADVTGLVEVDSTGATQPWFMREDLTAVALSPDGSQAACADGDDLYLVDPIHGSRDLAVESEGLKSAVKRSIHALAFSPDGKRLAIGAGKRVVELVLDNLSFGELVAVEEPVHWLAWHPSGERLVLLSGTTNLVTSLRGAALPTGTIPGSYHLSSMSVRDRAVEDIVEDAGDVRLVRPAISPDGQLVAFIASPLNNDEKVFVAAIGDADAVQITRESTCSFVAWRPPPPRASLAP